MYYVQVRIHVHILTLILILKKSISYKEGFFVKIYIGLAVREIKCAVLSIRKFSVLKCMKLLIIVVNGFLFFNMFQISAFNNK